MSDEFKRMKQEADLISSNPLMFTKEGKELFLNLKKAKKVVRRGLFMFGAVHKDDIRDEARIKKHRSEILKSKLAELNEDSEDISQAIAAIHEMVSAMKKPQPKHKIPLPRPKFISPTPEPVFEPPPIKAEPKKTFLQKILGFFKHIFGK